MPATPSSLPDPLTPPVATPAAVAAATSGAPTSSPFDIALKPLGFGDPLRWLLLGWRDFKRCPVLGGFFGACFALMGWCLMAVFQRAPAYTLALSAGFLLMGPFLCMGLYEASRDIEIGRKPAIYRSLTVWTERSGTLGIFGFVLLVLEMLWGRASLIVFAVSFDGMPDFKGSIFALLNPENLSFIVAYLCVGAVFAGLIFAVSVVSIPMILDRSTDAITAGLTSMRLVLTQPLVMLWWGLLLTVLVVLALLPGFLGLLVIGPVTGHASWHAYRGAVARDTEGPAAAA